MKQLKRCSTLLIGLLWLMLITNAVLANEEILLRKFVLRENNSPTELVASARFEYQLSDYLHQGLLNGVTLKHTVIFDLQRNNEWWWNASQPLVRVESELQYHALSQHYQVVRLDTQEHWNFPTLVSALEHLGYLEDYVLPTLPKSAFGSGSSIFMQVVLAPKSPALPLRLRSIFSDQYEMRSQGVVWPLP